MGDNIGSLKTDAKLLELLKNFSATPMTRKEVLDQRVSFVLGSMKGSVTREHVQHVIERQEGVSAEEQD